MKRLILTFCALFPLLVSAQLSLNPEVGINATNYPNRTQTAKAGFLLGVNLRMGDVLYFQPGMHLIKQAVTANIDTNSQTVVYHDISSYYLQFPLLLGLRIGPEAGNFRVYGGYLPSFFMGGNIENSSMNRSNFHHTLHAVRLGLGVDIWKVTLNSYFDAGVSDVFQFPDDVKYYTFSFALGVKIF